jgi:hypothetical protein
MLERIAAFASRHPSFFSGAWFAVFALLLTSPLGAMTLLLLGLEALGGRPVGAYVAMMFASVWLPLLPTFGAGALAGPQILRLPPGQRGRAAGCGAAVALGALLFWVLLLEAIPPLSFWGMPTTGGGGDVPGAAEVVGYLVVLPLMVLLALLVGAAAGLLLQVFAARSAANGEGSADRRMSSTQGSAGQPE